MKVKNRKLVGEIGLIRQIAQKQLPVKASYTLLWNVDHIESALGLYEKERKKLLDKYAEKDKGGKYALLPDRKTVKFKDTSSKDNFQGDMDVLLDIEADVDIKKLKLDDLGDAHFSVSELSAIEYMIDDGQKEK